MPAILLCRGPAQSGLKTEGRRASGAVLGFGLRSMPDGSNIGHFSERS
jgi:hypothetical protein